jgi:uncharacterized repeat protein (TIGR01451 family)
MKLRTTLALFTAVLLTRTLVGAPIVTSFSPVFGAASDQLPIDIYGTGFYVPPGNNVSVRFNGTLATGAVVTDTYGTNIQAFITSGTRLGPGQIQVTVNGLSTSNAAIFTVISSGPFITNFTPVIGVAGQLVHVQGVHFFNGSGVNAASFNGISAVIQQLVSDNQVDIIAPPGVQTGPIIVSSSVGSFSSITNIISSATNFFVRPFITGFSPSAGRVGTNVVITGSNFLAASSVTFGGIAATFTPPTNNTTLRAVVPAGAITGPISVDNPVHNPFTTSSNFLIQPTISGFSPGFGPVGTSVTVMGANFTDGTPSVKFGGVSAATPTGVSFGQLTCVVPAGATNAPITVTTTNGSATSSQLFYLPASISSFTPTNAPQGASVRVNGQNFLGATAVTFTGTGAVAPTVTNNTTLGVVVPAGVITGPISVTTPAGTVNSGAQLFYGPPRIDSFNPFSGLPGTNVTILGTNFLGATGVKFGGVSAATVTVVNNGQINTVVPNGAVTGPITVLAPGGTNSSVGTFALNYTDIGVSVLDAPDPVFVGSNLVYLITVANNSAFNATNVRLTNALPASVSLVAAATSQGSLNTNGNPVLGNLGTIGVGGQAVVTLSVVPHSTGTINDNISVGTDYPESAFGNNSAVATTTVWPLPVLSIALMTNQVQVAWPAPLSNFTLQYNPALAGNNDWSNLAIAPKLSGTNNVVLDGITNPARYYRLQH